MSVQFGKCNFDGKPVNPKDLNQVRPMLAPYGPDGEGYICRDNFGVLYRAFHTTKESRNELQPYLSASGTVITWDGRLDNREELIGQLHGALPPASTDLEIVAATYECWRTDAFARLIGDWALSIWNPKDRLLILAKDFVGTRHLYYSVEKDHVTWCTILDPLVLFAGRTFKLEEEYIAGWLAFFPAAHLTPYVGIRSVPPSSIVRLASGTQTASKYWDFDPAKKVRYHTDAEYEEHFRVVFSDSIRRRLRSDSPVLAELSGGMDSSSIVCMADDIIAKGQAETLRLDTVSYYDDSEPNWNERPYLATVEVKRGRAGWHIDLGTPEWDMLEFGGDRFAANPSSGEGSDEQFVACLVSNGNRVVLSGIAGDEVTGGVPTPLPELEDLLARARVREFVNRLKLWALEKRTPWIHLFVETTRRFLPAALFGFPRQPEPQPWLNPDFVDRNRWALQGYEDRLKLLGPLPSFQENSNTLCALSRQLECVPLPSEPPFEKRYPYLDRCLLEFLYAAPREQLVRPGQRRSLLRRSLSGIVPEEVLRRRRKAFAGRGIAMSICRQWTSLEQFTKSMVSSELGIVDASCFSTSLEQVRQGREAAVVPLMRTIGLELWLRRLNQRTCKRRLVSAETISQERR